MGQRRGNQVSRARRRQLRARARVVHAVQKRLEADGVLERVRLVGQAVAAPAYAAGIRAALSETALVAPPKELADVRRIAASVLLGLGLNLDGVSLHFEWKPHEDREGGTLVTIPRPDPALVASLVEARRERS